MTTEKKKRGPGRPKKGCKIGKAGRKTVMTPEVIKILEDAWVINCTDMEACLRAGISTSALKKYQVKNPEFKTRKRMLKDTLVFNARRKVAKEIENDSRLALRVLESKRPDEYGPKQKVEHSGGIESIVREIERKKKERADKND
jgi:hypothetical protein